MNLRERIENNLIVWLFSTLLAGFLAGIGTYKTILEVAQLEVVSKAKLEQLQATQREPAKDDAFLLTAPSDQVKAETTPVPPVSGPNKAVAPAQNLLKFSSQSPPFPEHYDSVKLGMRLSEARIAAPGGKLSADTYTIDLDTGPFSSVSFYVLAAEEDPRIEFVVFRFRDQAARQAVLTTALREFGNLPHRSESLGERLVWPDVNGFELTIEDSYDISNSEKKEKR
jgi:hypothetical protein